MFKTWIKAFTQPQILDDRTLELLSTLAQVITWTCDHMDMRSKTFSCSFLTCKSTVLFFTSHMKFDNCQSNTMKLLSDSTKPILPANGQHRNPRNNAEIRLTKTLSHGKTLRWVRLSHIRDSPGSWTVRWALNGYQSSIFSMIHNPALKFRT